MPKFKTVNNTPYKIAISNRFLLGLYSIFFSLFLTSCAEPNRTYVKSPDSRKEVTLEVFDGGAAASPRATLFLKIGTENAREIFNGRGGWPISAHWLDNSNLAIQFCDGKEYNVVSQIIEKEELVIKYINIIVVTHKDEVVFGNKYCEFKAN
jgi:hypothetical protein